MGIRLHWREGREGGKARRKGKKEWGRETRREGGREGRRKKVKDVG